MDSKSGVAQRTFLGHPLGLYVLFFAEMWERFSYYGMRALLMLYMVKYYKWSHEGSSSVYKWYTSLVYLTPILGGFLADRYLGNKNAVLIGALLMAIGHFLMAFDPYTAFFAALAFLIVGNGMFKPNMSTQVGRLYPPGDPRRDGAYTIFYMGINLGAMSPLLCGWLAEDPRFGYHAGFTAAGIGMLLGLLVYLFGMPLVKEIPQDEPVRPANPAAPGVGKSDAITNAPPQKSAPDADRPISEEEAERAPSAMPWLNVSAPTLLVAFAVVLAILGPALAYSKLLGWDSAIGLWIASGCAVLSAWICTRVHNAVRDRILAIMSMVIFVVVFWAAAEQAGNALNLWADQTTDRYLTHTAPDVPHPPARQPKADAGFLTFLNPVPTAWFQVINAFGIFVFAPLFAWWWTWNARKGRGTSIALKIVFGVFLMAMSLLFMLAGAWYENRPSSVKVGFTALPPGIEVGEDGKWRPKQAEGGDPAAPYHTGRLTFDREAGTLSMTGVLTDTERDRIVRDTAPVWFIELASALQTLSNKLEKDKSATVEVKVAEGLQLAQMLPDAEVVPVDQPSADPGKGKRVYRVTAKLPLVVRLPEVPPGFDLSLAEFDKNEATFDEASRTLTVNSSLADRDVKSLLVAAGEPAFRHAIYDLYSASAKHRVSSSWLLWFYLLATIGELYVSPVGLSMVSKLAPAKYATMLMGMWFLTSFFGNFLAGMAGENYAKFTPIDYFLGLFGVVLAVALFGFLCFRWVTALMHGVK